ncbi:MAG: ABC transporter ATP-binding protein [Nocardioidaceae bacterium]
MTPAAVRVSPAAAMVVYLRPHLPALIAGAVLSLATAATGLALPLVVRELIGRLGADRPVGGLILAMSALVLANAGIGATGSYVLERAAESVVLDARHLLVERLLRLRLFAVEETEPGDLMTRVTADADMLRGVVTDTFVGGVTGSITLVATLAMMGFLDPVLFLVTLAALAAAVVVIGFVVPRIGRAARHAREAVGALGAVLERVFGAFRTVKASGAEARETARLHHAASTSFAASIRAAKWSALAGNTAGLAVQGAFLAVLSVGGGRVAAGQIDVATLVAFLLYIYYLMPPANAVSGAVTEYQSGAAAVTRILEVQRLPVEADPPHAAVFPVRTGPATVEFRRVDFRYRVGLPLVHRQVSFCLPAGGMTAIVGPSGAGKTTVFSLLERFYDVEAGHLLVDGTDVAQWPLARLRAAIGYVEQDAPVLSGTLAENLRFGAPDATDEQLAQALRTTRLDSMVAALPAGLDTTVGHRGVKLSGGERQRVAVARALLREPRLLLLDEATSQLDAVNESALRETIADIAATTTVLVVAHRLSTVTTADRIIVMDAGEIRSVGTHQELVAADPLYGELAATQFLATRD